MSYLRVHYPAPLTLQDVAADGELVQWDASEHDWLEGRGEKLYLIGMIDDATSQIERALRTA